MKTANELTRMLRGSALALAAILFATVPANAQYKATDGIAEEQYLRNVVDVIYRTRTGAAAEPVASL